MRNLKSISAPNPLRLFDAILKLPPSEEKDIVATEFTLYTEQVSKLLNDFSHNMEVMQEDTQRVFDKLSSLMS